MHDKAAQQHMSPPERQRSTKRYYVSRTVENSSYGCSAVHQQRPVPLRMSRSCSRNGVKRTLGTILTRIAAQRHRFDMIHSSWLLSQGSKSECRSVGNVGIASRAGTLLEEYQFDLKSALMTCLRRCLPISSSRLDEAASKVETRAPRVFPMSGDQGNATIKVYALPICHFENYYGNYIWPPWLSNLDPIQHGIDNRNTSPKFRCRDHKT